ncbi:ppx/GppA phosphatase family protein [Sarocladium implicatum]|nr:ppx/GppA phosphatase family protein [Sarocladium implicatum]
MAPSDVITLQNLEQKLPRWFPTAGNHLQALVDMGSNGIRFSITDLAPPTTRLMPPIYSTRAAISLFDALTPSEAGLIFPDTTISSVSAALAGFYRQAVQQGVPQANFMILATEAMRRAANGGRMLEAIAEATDGLGVYILDPAVETLCGAVMGSRSSLATLPQEGALFLDLGGGSVQMTWVDPSEPDYQYKAAEAGVSLPFGAAKLIRILNDEDASVCQDQLSALRSGMSMAYDHLCKRFPRLQDLRKAYQQDQGGSVKAYMCGGGFRGYGSMLMHTDEAQPYPFSTVNGYLVSGAQFKDTSRLRKINGEYQKSIFGLSSRRRAQFPAIVTVIEAFTEAVPNIGSVTFCGGSNREGALMMMLPGSVRESDPLEVLADLKEREILAFDHVAILLRQAIPEDCDLNMIPTIFSTSILPLVLKEIWSRQAYDQDVNTSFALRNAIIRDTGAPGLSHQNRALLALSLSAHWGGDLSPADTLLKQQLQTVLDRAHAGTSFWAAYFGSLLRVIADTHPTLTASGQQATQIISIESCIQRTAEKQDLLSLTIVIHAKEQSINAEKMSKKLKGNVKSADANSPLRLDCQIIANP